MSPVDVELRERLVALAPEEKRQLLEYLRTMGSNRPPTASGAELLRFAGTIPEEELRQMWQVIEADRELARTDEQ